MNSLVNLRLDTGWVLGDQGADCGATCAKTERVCSGAEGATLTTNELVGAAFAEAGYTCLSYHGPQEYAGKRDTILSRARSNRQTR